MCLYSMSFSSQHNAIVSRVCGIHESYVILAEQIETNTYDSHVADGCGIIVALVIV